MAMWVDPNGDGCPDLAIPHCLECPLPACRWELPPRAAWTMVRAQQRAALLASPATNVAVAAALGISVRTVIRYRYGQQAALRR